MRYKGVYRLHTPIDLVKNTFPREYDGSFADNDIYILCKNKVQIFSFGRGILQAYIPSIGRGNNIIKAIKDDFQGEEIIFDIEKTDIEILFKFHAKHLERLSHILKPKTFGADRSPFSSKNLPKAKYKIPDEDMCKYKLIVESIGKNRLLELSRTTNSFLQSLSTKKNTWENIKADMSVKCIKGKEYIHSIGKWNDYIKYLENNL